MSATNTPILPEDLSQDQRELRICKVDTHTLPRPLSEGVEILIEAWNLWTESVGRGEDALAMVQERYCHTNWRSGRDGPFFSATRTFQLDCFFLGDDCDPAGGAVSETNGFLDTCS